MRGGGGAKPVTGGEWSKKDARRANTPSPLGHPWTLTLTYSGQSRGLFSGTLRRQVVSRLALRRGCFKSLNSLLVTLVCLFCPTWTCTTGNSRSCTGVRGPSPASGSQVLGAPAPDCRCLVRPRALCRAPASSGASGFSLVAVQYEEYVYDPENCRRLYYPKWPGYPTPGGVWHKALVSDCLPLAAPIGLSPMLIRTLCGPNVFWLCQRSPRMTCPV